MHGIDIEIVWEDDKVVSVSVPYDDISNHIEVVILEQEPFLMIKGLSSAGGKINYILEEKRIL